MSSPYNVTTHRCWVYGSHVNTDEIFPGKYTYTLKAPEEIAAHALEGLDPAFAANVQVGDVIVAGENWGCGSSREQGVTALKYAGVYAIIAVSFSGLYFRNCINQGVLPVVCPQLWQHVHTGDTLQINLSTATITVRDHVFGFPRLSSSVQAIMDAGGLLPMLQRRFSEQQEGA